MKKIAILIDGEFFSIALRRDLKLLRRPSALQIYQHALRLADVSTEDIWRILYYDSHSSCGRAWHPITRQLIELAETPQAKARERFLSELGQMDLIALRCGQTHPRGWHLSEQYLSRLAQGSLRPPTANDYELRFEQKGVDMRIGLDVAMLALNHQVDRMVVVTNDTDLVPALKVARRHGVQVVVAQIGSFYPHHDLIADSDFKRVYKLAA